MELGSTAMLGTLEKVESTMGQHFEIGDWRGARIILGAAAAHYIAGQPLWLRIVGPSRSGRTELLGSLLEDDDSVEMESLTPASIRGGFKGGKRVLDRIKGKRVITKDLAPLITLRKDTRLELFGLLRSVKDGYLSSDFGTEEGHIHQEASFDWILAVTPAIESVRQIESLLGERYVDLQWIAGNREEMAYRAAVNNPHLKEIRNQLAANVCSLLVRAKEVVKDQMLELTEEETRYIAKCADSVALCRSPILKDSSGHIVSMPKPEIGTSLAQDFSRVALGLKLLGIQDWQPYIQRLAWDCIPSVRAAILVALQSQPLSASELGKKLGLPESSVYFHLRDLGMLGVLESKGEKRAITVYLPSSFKKN